MESVKIALSNVVGHGVFYTLTYILTMTGIGRTSLGGCR